jgi:transposase-like protein
VKYSIAFKENVVRRILPPNNESVRAVSKEIGVSENSIYIWIKKLKEGTLGKDGDVYPSRRQPKEKLRLLLEGKIIPDDKRGEWLRKNGLHTEHLHQFEQEIREIVDDKADKQKEENRRLKSENKDLKRELRRKEKALAEMAALLTLKKKADDIWGDPEDD